VRTDIKYTTSYITGHPERSEGSKKKQQKSTEKIGAFCFN
jgi:hypothetical protein